MFTNFHSNQINRLKAVYKAMIKEQEEMKQRIELEKAMAEAKAAEEIQRKAEESAKKEL